MPLVIGLCERYAVAPVNICIVERGLYNHGGTGEKNCITPY